MKILFLLFMLFAQKAWSSEDWGKRADFRPPEGLFEAEETHQALFNDTTKQLKELKQVKYHLINGEIRLAKVLLNQMSFTQTKLRPILKRYLAMISFTEGKFEETYSHLSLPELQNIPQYGKICILKVLTEIVLNKTNELENNWRRCQLENSDKFKQKNLLWLETLIQLKLAPQKGITQIPFKRLRLASLDLDEAKIMLKLALYLNQEKLIIDQINDLTDDQVADQELREIVGQVLFRTGSFAQSYKFIEDLKSPNSENIKGNLYILREKYELAYAQFKLALEQKQNSQNAMERLLPLAWVLGDWENGTLYSERVIASPNTQINKMTLVAAFQMQKGDYDKASKILEIISQRSRKGTELDVTQLGSFTALMQNKVDLIKKQSSLSCAQYDYNNCWLQFQLNQWETFPLTIKREDKVVIKKTWEELTQSEKNEPLQEELFINQLDIEEMDDKQIQLIPSP